MGEHEKLEIVNHFFRVHALSTDQCLEPNEKCDNTTIRAHSIPSGSVLSFLADDGHVVMPQMKLKFPPPAEISFKRIGVRKATTFTGLCSRHDNDIFRPIDDELPDWKNVSHLFLLAYRAVLREYYVCLQNAVRFQSTYQKRIELGLSPGTEPCPAGMLSIGQLMNTFECYEYKRRFDQMFLAMEWNGLEHHTIVLNAQRATVAVSSMFSLDDIDAPETPRVTLSVWPMDTGTVVVLSSLPRDARYVSVYLSRVLASSGYFQKYLLSKLILQSCDNFVVAPKYYDSLTQSQRDGLCEFYAQTAIENAEDHEDQRLYLF